MARDNNQMVAGADGSSDGASGLGFVDEAGEVAIAEKIAEGNAHQSSPNGFLKLAAMEFQRDIERFSFSGEVLLGLSLDNFD